MGHSKDIDSQFRGLINKIGSGDVNGEADCQVTP